MARTVFITAEDKKKLLHLINQEKEFGTGDKEFLRSLEHEINMACVTQSENIPSDVITMNSRVMLRDLDSGEEMVYSLVYPGDADLTEGKISVLAPVGTAILGYREGDILTWDVPGGVARLKVETILYQPEAAGHFDR